MGSPGVMGGKELAVFINGTWEHEQIFQGNLETKWILGCNLGFLLGEQSKSILGNKGDFGNFSREHRNTDPLGPHKSPTVDVLCGIHLVNQR